MHQFPFYLSKLVTPATKWNLKFLEKYIPERSSAAGAQYGKTGKNVAMELQQQKPMEHMWLSGNTYPAQHMHSLPNRDHQYHAMESLLWSPAKDHVTSSWAWSHLISTSGKALLSVTTLGCFTLSPGSHTPFSAILSWYVLVCCWLSISMAHRPFKGISKHLFAGGWEWKLSGGNLCWSWALWGKTEKLVLVVKVWLLLRNSPCFYWSNPQAAFMRKTSFSTFGEKHSAQSLSQTAGHLCQGQWPLFPVMSTPSHQ